MKLNDLDGHMSDAHSMKIIYRIIDGKDTSIITNKDRQMLVKSSIIREIHKDLPNGLIAEAKRYSKFMYPEDLVLFFVLAYENDVMNYAKEVLEVVEYDRRLMSLSDLIGSLSQESDLPAEWAAGLFGEIGEERFEKPDREIKMPSTIDPSRLKIDL